jgi:hypothetical protein
MLLRIIVPNCGGGFHTAAVIRHSRCDYLVCSPSTFIFFLVEYSSDYEAQLYELIRLHNKLIPPYLDMSNQEISNILKRPSHYLDLRFPNDGGEEAIYMYVHGEEIICAAQIAFSKEGAYFYWLVTHPNFMEELDELINSLKYICLSKGCRTLGFRKNAFGVGWAGVPNCWGDMHELLK